MPAIFNEEACFGRMESFSGGCGKRKKVATGQIQAECKQRAAAAVVKKNEEMVVRARGC